MQVIEQKSVNDIEIADIYFKNKLQEHNIYFQLVEKIASKIKLIPNYSNLRIEIELIKTICNLIENAIKKGNSKRSNPINKKKLVIDTMNIVFNLSQSEIDNLNSIIDFLFNNKHIKKLSYTRLITNFFSKYIH